MRYRIKLINLKTNETKITTWCYSNKKNAVEFAKRWDNLGHPFKASVIDELKKEVIY